MLGGGSPNKKGLIPAFSALVRKVRFKDMICSWDSVSALEINGITLLNSDRFRIESISTASVSETKQLEHVIFNWHGLSPLTF
jgi:hypothetical protein